MLDTYLPSSLVVGMVAVGCGGPPTTESTMARGGAPVTAASAGASGPSPSPPARASSTLNVVQNVEGTREASVPGLRKVDRAALIDDLTRVTDQAIGARKQPNDFAQLVGVRADSLVAKLGLENGDRLLWSTVIR